MLIPLAISAIALAQAGSSSYRRYLRCQAKADESASTEDLCRRRAAVCEEMSPRLREVAALSRELASSASGEIERSRWLEMARLEEDKAARFEREAGLMITRADRMSARADELSRLAWRPWLAEPN